MTAAGGVLFDVEDTHSQARCVSGFGVVRAYSAEFADQPTRICRSMRRIRLCRGMFLFRDRSPETREFVRWQHIDIGAGLCEFIEIFAIEFSGLAGTLVATCNAAPNSSPRRNTRGLRKRRTSHV